MIDIKNWYPSEIAKRNIGKLCDHVKNTGSSVLLLGSAEMPLLVLAALDEPDRNGQLVALEDLRANWNTLTLTVSIYGKPIFLTQYGLVVAKLSQHPYNRHPIIKYRPADGAENSPQAELQKIACSLERIEARLAKLESRENGEKQA